jgi:hypothetical protein
MHAGKEAMHIKVFIGKLMDKRRLRGSGVDGRITFK